MRLYCDLETDQLIQERQNSDNSLGKEKVIPPYHCAELLSRQSSLSLLKIYVKLERLYLYNGDEGYYKALSYREFEVLIHPLLSPFQIEPLGAPKYVNGVIAKLKIVEPIAVLGEPRFDISKFVFKNGTLDLHTLELGPWSADYFVTSRLDFSVPLENDVIRSAQ